MTIRRRALLLGALSTLVARFAVAQTRSARIGILGGVPREKSVLIRPLLRALADLGYREGSAVLVEYRFGTDERDLRRVARELAASKHDLIFALAGEAEARALRDASSGVPVVFIAALYDPVKIGLVKSLARPGGDMTGVHIPIASLAAKRLEIARDILPSARRFLVFTDGDTHEQLAATRSAAASRGVELVTVEFAGPSYDLAAGFETGQRARADGFLPFVSAGFQVRRAELSKLILRHRLPTISSGTMTGDPAILASYHSDFGRHLRRAAQIGVRILNGAKPADIPVEEPDAFELVLNLDAARAIGVTIPQSVVARATKIIP